MKSGCFTAHCVHVDSEARWNILTDATRAQSETPIDAGTTVIGTHVWTPIATGLGLARADGSQHASDGNSHDEYPLLDSLAHDNPFAGHGAARISMNLRIKAQRLVPFIPRVFLNSATREESPCPRSSRSTAPRADRRQGASPPPPCRGGPRPRSVPVPEGTSSASTSARS